MANFDDFDRDQLQHLMEDDDSIPEIDAADAIAESETIISDETIDSGVRRMRRDDAEMGFGAEPRSIDELADATLGHEMRGRRATQRDDE
ncbi:MAG: hypothetical protein ABIT38_13055, partial [Gemmatimonadaceae bacterium]